jgi:hypothetical protein
MESFDGNAVAIGLARYVRDFLPGPCHGVTTIRQVSNDGALFGVYCKPSLRRGGRAELDLYESFLLEWRLDVVGRGIVCGGDSWAVLVRADTLARQIEALLLGVLERYVLLDSDTAESAARSVHIDRNVRAWCDWWCAASKQ